MRKSVRYGIAAALVVAIFIGVVWSRRSTTPDPVYKGKRLSVWLRGFDYTSPFPPGKQVGDRRTAAMEAVRQLGTNAIPQLLSLLRTHDTALETKLMNLAESQHLVRINFTRATTLNAAAEAGIANLIGDTRTTVIIPELIKLYDQEGSSASRQTICRLFYRFATETAAAAPSIARRLMTSPNNTERGGAINALRRIKAQPSIVVPALINTLHDPVLNNQADAAYALAVYGTNATDAVVPLIELLNDPTRPAGMGMPFVNIPAAVQFALEHIDPAAAGKVFRKSQ